MERALMTPPKDPHVTLIQKKEKVIASTSETNSSRTEKERSETWRSVTEGLGAPMAVAMSEKIGILNDFVVRLAQTKMISDQDAMEIQPDGKHEKNRTRLVSTET